MPSRRGSSPDAGNPYMAVPSTIKATPRYSFSRAGLGSPMPNSAHRAGSPGPLAGDYVPGCPGSTSKMSSSPNVSFTSSRTGRLSQSAVSVPGPGSYESKAFMSKSSKPHSWPFGQSSSTGRLEKAASSTPGPGAYEPPPVSVMSPVNSPRGVRGRPMSGSGAENPGFGSSVARKISPRGHSGGGRASSPSATNGASGSRWCGNTPGEVGPGAYDRPLQRKAPSAKFPTSPRFGGSRPSSPGPGSYEPESRQAKGCRFGSTGARPSLAGVCRATGTTVTPGPGSYEVGFATDTTKVAPQAYSMRGRAKDMSAPSPGPGDYGGANTMFR